MTTDDIAGGPDQDDLTGWSKLGTVSRVGQPDRLGSIAVSCGPVSFDFGPGLQPPRVGSLIHILNLPGGNIRGVAIDGRIVYTRRWPFYFEQTPEDPALRVPHTLLSEQLAAGHRRETSNSRRRQRRGGGAR